MGKDFFVAYSPERINPGDKVNTIETIVKVVGACDDATLDTVAKTYDLVVKAGTHRASSIRVAEASKIIENTQRDVNIALVNELSIICDKVGIDTLDVLEAAATKWNFQHFKPGLVGGHCIGVDPYYLTWKANKLGYHARVINSGRYVNDSMGFYVGKQTVKRLLARGINPLEAKVLVMGLTFKEDVADIRNTKVIDVVRELESFNVKVDVLDPQGQRRRGQRNTTSDLVLRPARRLPRRHCGREPRRVRFIRGQGFPTLAEGWPRHSHRRQRRVPRQDGRPRLLEPLSVPSSLHD